MYRVDLFVIVAALTCFSCLASATDNLIGLYQKAALYDAEYLAALASTKADREEINKARAQFFPKAQLVASRGQGITDRTTQTAIGAIDTHLDYDIQNYALSIKQPLFNKETLATYSSAKSFVSAKEQLLRQENAKLMLKLASTYLEILYAKEKTILLTAKINAVTQQLNQAQKKFQQGAGTVVEIGEAQTNLDIAKAELILANNALTDHRESLFNMTGVDSNTQQAVSDTKLDAARLPTEQSANESLDFWLASAKQHNPEISAAEYAVEVARQEIEKKRAGHYPTLDLVGVRSYSENDSNNTLGSRFDTTTLAVQLNMPLFAGGFVNASVRQAVSKLTAAEESLKSTTREATANIRKYFNGMQSQFLSIAAYQQAVKSSDTTLVGTQKGFVAGLKTNIEVLEAQQKLFNSQLELSKAQYGLVNELVNLKYNAGLLNEIELAKISQLFMPANNVGKRSENHAFNN
jgi:TolC family type I secretion outer membrane protein